MMFPDAYIEIVEEPAPKLKRFRYESEGRSAPLQGVRTTENKKSFPSIRIVNYTGMATVFVSCVTAEEPHRQHPHKLLGKNCENGVCYIPQFYTDSRDPKVISFRELRIQSCKIPEIPARLAERTRLNINPFDLSKCGVDNLKRDIHTVRLCFQVLISPDPKNPTPTAQLEPKVSQPIINNKAAAEVKIHNISDTFSPASGGKKIMIFCNTIAKDDIEIRFYEEDAEKNQKLIGLGSFKHSNIHRDVGIAFTTPKCDLKSVKKPQNIFIEMVRPSDDVRSNRFPFQYVPDVTDIDVVKMRKQSKMDRSEQFLKLLDSRAHNTFTNNIPHQYNIPPQGLPQHHSFPEQHDLPQQQNLQQQYQKLAQQPLDQSLPHHNPSQQQNLPQHSSNHYSMQQYNHNLPQHLIPQEQSNVELQQYDPQRHNGSLQNQYNPQHGYVPQQDERQPNYDELNQELLNFEGLSCCNPFEEISPNCSLEDQLMLSANDNWNSGHNVAGPAPKN